MKQIAIFLIPFSIAFGDMTFTYEKEAAGERTRKTYVIKENEKGIVIEGTGHRGKTEVDYNFTYDIQKMTFRSNNGDWTYDFKREGNELVAEGKRNGRFRSKNYSLKRERWIQEFDFGMKPFILSNDNKFYFLILNPKDLDAVDMVASKVGMETLTIQGKPKLAQRIKITLDGFKSMFWSAKAWYDPETGDLLKYHANEGPGTPTATITLVEKSDS